MDKQLLAFNIKNKINLNID